MKLRLYNTLSRSVEEFVPIDRNNVRMYVCGPTVYSRAHLGNARPAVVFDVLHRILRKIYANVKYVRNITDVDDKIYKAAIAENISISELTNKTVKQYHEDIASLNVLPVTIEPRATEHISEIIKFIQILLAEQKAYISNNHVYFDINSAKNYGKLSRKKLDELISGARVDISANKKNPLDFVLWKPTDEQFNFGWDSPWGKGRPGWHIECSAMSKKYLGEVFDIHGGGADLVFPHHENEIAQSCALTHQERMANYWIHNGHLTVNGTKMSKSLGNYVTVNELLQRFDGEVIRFAFLMSHYRSSINFSIDMLNQAKNILDRWYTALETSEFIPTEEVFSDVTGALLDDMNTPKAISILHNKIDEINKTHDGTLANIFTNTCRSLLGIMQVRGQDWFRNVDENTRIWITEQIKLRNIAKEQRNFVEADTIRDELLRKGIIIEDTKDGTTWKVKT